MTDLLPGVHPGVYGGALLAVAVGALLLARTVRGAPVWRVLSALTGVAGLALSAEAFYELARVHFGLPVWASLVVAGVLEGFALTFALAAEHALRAGRVAQARRLAGVVWGFAALAGVLAAISSDGLVEAAGRGAIPLAVAAQWHALAVYRWPVLREREELRWLWTPSRLLVAVGAMSPSGSDLDAVDRARRERRAAREAAREAGDGYELARLSLRIEQGGASVVQRWRHRRFARLVERASDASVHLAVEQRARAERARGDLGVHLHPVRRGVEPEVHPVQAPSAPPVRVEECAEVAPLVRTPRAPAPVEERRAAVAAAGEAVPTAELARRFGVSRTTIDRDRQKVAELNGHAR